MGVYWRKVRWVRIRGRFNGGRERLCWFRAKGFIGFGHKEQDTTLTTIINFVLLEAGKGGGLREGERLQHLDFATDLW